MSNAIWKHRSVKILCFCAQAQWWEFFETSPFGLEPARLLSPSDSPGKNPGVGHHFLLQASSQPKDWTHVFFFVCVNLLFFFFFFFIVVDFVIHWNETAMGLHVFPTLLCPLNCRQILYPLSHQGKVLRGCEIHIRQQVRYWATLLLPSALIPWSDGVHLTPNKHYKTSARNKSFVSEFDRLGELL